MRVFRSMMLMVVIAYAGKGLAEHTEVAPAPNGRSLMEGFELRCDDPYRAFCEPEADRLTGAINRLWGFQEKVFKRYYAEATAEAEMDETAVKATLKTLNEQEDRRQGGLRFEVDRKDAVAALSTGIYFRKLDENLRGPLEGHLDRVRELIISAALDELPEGKRRDEIIARLKKARIASWYRVWKRAPESLTDSFQGCGQTGMHNNAFFLLDTGELVICPSLFVAVTYGGLDGRGNLPELMHAVGHEFGHSFDAERASDLYPRYAACVRTMLSHASPIDEKALKGWMSEITADYWGAEVLGRALKAEKDPRKNFLAIKNTVQFACQRKGREYRPSDRYPSARDRVNLLGRSKILRERMGCPEPSAESPVCTLRGSEPVPATQNPF